ncbi:MAG: hypothetical protein ACRD0N_10370 [Acidimicrobiales bacterium]
MPEIPPPDPEKLLASWMQWEQGQLTPGRVMADLKKGGLRDLLEATVQARREIVTG